MASWDRRQSDAGAVAHAAPQRLICARRSLLLALPAFAALGRKGWAAAADGTPLHGLSLFGDLKYGPDFKHFDYVDPNAPKGGTVKRSAIGTFDTLNPFTLKGVPAAGIDGLFDTLLAPAYDEPDSAYGLIAESVAVAPDRTSAIYTLRQEARFHDGSPIGVADVIWTLETLKTQGHPRYRLYYADVIKAEPAGERSVRFVFRSGDNRELPQIVGQLPVLSKAYWSTRDFAKTTLETPLGNGVYTVASVDAGRSIVYRRVADYWAKDLPVNVGRNNFGAIRYDYYRDASIALEAFKAGQYDIRIENVAKNWAIGYASPALKAGLIKQQDIANKVPQGMQAFGYNTRKPLFRDPRVRRALSYLFDFEWSNKNLFYGAYIRTKSYFSNSDLASAGLPQGDELALLQKLKGEIPDTVFTEVYEPPKTDGSGNIRPNLHQALRLLYAAGWTIKNGKLVDAEDRPFVFEFLLVMPEFERVVLPFGQNLARAGITMNVRTIDPAQYENRMRNFDFDMSVLAWGESLSPGNEQRDYWGSAAADEPGSSNLLGIKSKAVDALIDGVIHAQDRHGLVTATHALDRVLLHGYYVIPNWHLNYFRVARWDKFGEPRNPPPYALALDTWWIDKARDRDVETKKQQVQK
ncbi:MAG TPA: extracellular solute-binding protein [Stellaceae bacterium]|nr:extracellular solute-binding protein [Stellaceae bacterium]